MKTGDRNSTDARNVWIRSEREGGKLRETYAPGEVAFWTPVDCFGLLFSYERPKLSAPTIVMGKVNADPAAFDTLGGAVDMLFEVENKQ